MRLVVSRCLVGRVLTSLAEDLYSSSSEGWVASANRSSIATLAAGSRLIGER